MSVLIKGMKLPGNCTTCPMQCNRQCYAVEGDKRKEILPVFVYKDNRDKVIPKPDWCPMIEINSAQTAEQRWRKEQNDE